MSATAFKNAVRRREHYERHQPEARQRFGLLEKKKDYVQRAKNFHDKEKRISELRKKAANRNPDEFYFRMTKTATKRGVHKADSDGPLLTADTLKVLKTQDKTYIQTQLSAEEHKIQRLKAALHFPEGGAANSHVVFEEGGARSVAPRASSSAAAAAAPEPVPVLPAASRSKKRKRPADVAKAAAVAAAAALTAARATRHSVDRERRRAYGELAAREARAKQLSSVGEHMDLSRALLRKGKRHKVKDGEEGKPAVYQWKPVRLR